MLYPDSSILTHQTRLVVFDLDGTLYVKKCMVWRMLKAAPREWRMMLAERKTRRALRGQYFETKAAFDKAFFQLFAEIRGCSEQDAIEWYDNVYMPLMVGVIRKYYKSVEWLPTFAEECKKRDIRLVVLSDYGHTREKLAALNIEEHLFDWVVSAPELGGLKPAPQLMHQVAERMNVTPDQCLVIGDREDTDGLLAKETGARFFLV
jgi:HAD superfamily hydrolase (TIGR01509 family)